MVQWNSISEDTIPMILSVLSIMLRLWVACDNIDISLYDKFWHKKNFNNVAYMIINMVSYLW